MYDQKIGAGKLMAENADATLNGSNTSAANSSGIDYQAMLEFVSEMAASLAWPITVLIIIFWFKPPIISVLTELESLSFGGMEAKMNKNLKKATEIVKSIEQPEETVNSHPDSGISDLFDKSVLNPAGAIVDAWKDVEKTARSIVENSGLSLVSTPSRPYFSLQKFMMDNELLPKPEIDTFRELRIMRNRAAKASDFEITTDQARQYIRLANRLVATMKQYVEK
jgi:hypothetical protein